MALTRIDAGFLIVHFCSLAAVVATAWRFRRERWALWLLAVLWVVVGATAWILDDTVGLVLAAAGFGVNGELLVEAYETRGRR